MKSTEIFCDGCGRRTMTRKEAVYDGFKKTGERVICLECGFRYEPGSKVPYAETGKAPAVFSDDDKPAAFSIFADDELRHCCRHCKSYLVNAFDQYCSKHEKKVEATDLCFDFAAADAQNGEKK